MVFFLSSFSSSPARVDITFTMADGMPQFFDKDLRFYERKQHDTEIEVEVAIAKSVHSCKAFASRYEVRGRGGVVLFSYYILHATCYMLHAT